MSDECGFCEVHQCYHGAPGEEARGERHAVVAHIRRAAASNRKFASAIRADAGTQGEQEAQRYDQAASALILQAEAIADGRHWR